MRATKRLMATALAAVLVGTAAQADVTISKQPTQNMNCQAGVCSPRASDAVLNVSDLANLLASGDLKVTTGSGATNIVLKDTLGWTSTSRLTFDAIQSVEIDRPVMVTGTGAVTITTNDGGTGGDLLFGEKGNLTFWDQNSSLIVNGNSYTLVGDIQTLASDIANNPSGFYALANDYDASVDGTYGSSPVATKLSGTFEGLGHVISNLSINSSGSAGLFDGATGVLRDIGLSRVAITGVGDAASLLVEGDQMTIIGCYATGSTTSSAGFFVGGLVAKPRYSSSDGAIERSHAAVSVAALLDGADAGGLVGFSAFAISNSYATGNVSGGNNASSGGLIGTGEGSVSQSYATGKVSGGEGANIGGLVGSGGGIHIYDSYATGSVKGGATPYVGGFAGEVLSADIESSYSTGHVAGKESGGFLGDGTPSILWNYWDTDSSGRGRRHGCGYGHCHSGIKGQTTEQFLSGLPHGFDPAIWGQKKNINGGYPYLLALPPH